MYGLFLFLLGVLAFIVPGFLLILVVYRGRSWEEAVIRAPSFGFAAGVYVAFTLSYIQLALFWYAWALIALALALMLWRRQFKLPGFALPDLLRPLAVYRRWAGAGHAACADLLAVIASWMGPIISPPSREEDDPRRWDDIRLAAI